MLIPMQGFLLFMGKWEPVKRPYQSIVSSVGVQQIFAESFVYDYQRNKTKDGDSLFHFDFYRIRKLEEVMDIGYEEYFFSGIFCFIEWPEKIEHYCQKML